MRNITPGMIFFMVFLTLSVPPLAAQDKEEEKSIPQVLELIRHEQGVTANRDIVPAKVSDKLLEELGDAVMSTAHPDQEEHEWMDRMMGGEGSESLEAMHRAMGYRYLENQGWLYPDYRDPEDRGPRSYGNGMMGNGYGGPMRGR
jgi:hypothetical protein